MVALFGACLARPQEIPSKVDETNILPAEAISGKETFSHSETEEVPTGINHAETVVIENVNNVVPVEEEHFKVVEETEEEAAPLKVEHSEIIESVPVDDQAYFETLEEIAFPVKPSPQRFSRIEKREQFVPVIEHKEIVPVEHKEFVSVNHDAFVPVVTHEFVPREEQHFVPASEDHFVVVDEHVVPQRDEFVYVEPVAILRDERVHSEDGSYNFDFETEDGIIRSEAGSLLPHANNAIGQVGTIT